ncbi:DUF4012 domain-containing protein [Microbacterium halophytorum]|uniref:DUF4012 domain-containing protein n=1 Tax=Microbacterium halophytorum TaxID=2067568 RepID=UPI000CFC035C|nr:DUF4012 domain-containing protein [Microbacterium halophytorum]
MTNLSAASAPRRSAGGRRRPRRWPWITALVILLILIVCAIFGFIFVKQALDVRQDLLAAKTELSAVVGDVESGDADAMQASADEILEHTTSANEKVSTPLWAVASHVPFVGQNVDAVRRTTQATHVLVEDALPPGLTIMSSMDLGSADVEGGGLDLTPLIEAQDSLPQISDAFAEAESIVADIDRENLIPMVDGAIGSVLDIIETASPTVQVVADNLPTILQIAGAEEPQRYMLVFQNNAEIRSGGGLPAATAVVDVANGKADLAEQTSTYTFRRDIKVIDPPDEMEQLYDGETFTGFGNFTRTPNFPTTAEAFDSLWNMTTGESLDGVMSLDPVVLSHILGVTGPVTASDGTELTEDNVVEQLLYETYVRYPGEQQDLFFSDVAARVFETVAAGDYDALAMLDALSQGAEEQRLNAWFPDEASEDLMVELGIDGALPTDNAETTEVGIFLNDYAASKLEYFLESDVRVSCDAGAGTMTTDITVANNVPPEGMTEYQLGIRNKGYGIPTTSFILDTMYFAPPGSEITESTPGDDPGATRTGVERERNVVSNRYFVASGESRTFSFTSTIPDGDNGPVSVRYSPSVTDTPVDIEGNCDGAM